MSYNNLDTTLEPVKTKNSLSDFNYWTTKDIVPLYVFAGVLFDSKKTILEEILDIDPLEFNSDIFYFIDYETHSEEVLVNNVKKYVTKYTTSIYKVIKNLISFTVIQTDKDEMKKLGFTGKTKTSCKFTLPKIPYQMREKMDIFFREVYKKYRSEAIVLLTYNPTVGGSEGWDILIPKQSNNAGHCNYDPSSIADQQHTDAYIVGSAHSHPEMPAYASGTDHDDQEGFDGLHITYGWSRATGGKTEYYAEIQVEDSSWPIDESIFFEEQEIVREVPEEIVKAISDRVEPSVVTPMGSYYSNNSGYVPHSSTKQQHSTTYPNKKISQNNLVKYKNYLGELDNPIIIGAVNNLLSYKSSNCPFCDTPLVPLEINRRRCFSCSGYIMDDLESLSSVVTARANKNIASSELDASNPNRTHNVYKWDPTIRVPNLAFDLLLKVDSDIKK